MLASAVTIFLHSENSPSQASTYPDHIVNSGFEYPNIKPYMGTVSGWVQVNPDDKTVYVEGNAARTSVPTMDPSAVGWKSSQTYTSGVWAHAGDIQYMKETQTTNNQYVELTSNEANTYIYQDISTPHSGYVYKWQLDHCARGAAIDRMRVKIGKPGVETVQTAWRIKSNGSGKIGEEMTVIATDNSADKFKNGGYSDYNRTGWFETYEGVYVIPAGQTVTRFTFESLDASSAGGNCLDNIFFAICHPLYYELCGGIGDLPIPQASGRYPGYHPQGSTQILSSVVPTRAGYTFLGWSDQRHADVTTSSIPSDITFITQKQIAAGSNYVYAIWAKNPTITFRDSITGESISSIQIPYNTSVPTVDIPVTQAKAGYRFTGYSIDPAMAFTQDTTIDLLYEPAGRIRINVNWIDRDNMANSREDLLFSIPQDSDPNTMYNVRVAKDADSAAVSYLPSINDPKEEIFLPGESKYKLSSVSITCDSSTDDVTTITYNVSVRYIPTTDLAITKIWDDMDDVYKERPESITVEIYCDDVELPADTDQEFTEEEQWRLYDTVTLTPDMMSTSSDQSWKTVIHNVPLWSYRGHSGDVLVDAHYKIKEVPVKGYDLVSCNGNIQDGFVIKNKVFGHTVIPATGINSYATFIGLVLAALTGMSVYVFWRTRKWIKSKYE